MQSPSGNLRKLDVDPESTIHAVPNTVHAALHPVRLPDPSHLGPSDLDRSDPGMWMWHDVFVHRPLPWSRFLQSALLHAGAIGLIWLLTTAWLRQQNIAARPTFDPSAVVTYSPQEYLPPLDTGAPRYTPPQKGDPVYARQEILSVPPEPDNRRQTIVAPPNLKLNRDLPLPNIVAMGSVAPAIPLEATRARLTRLDAPQTDVVAPAPELDSARSRTAQKELTSDVIAPPPELTVHQSRGAAGPDASVVAPPPELAKIHGRAGTMNIGPSAVVAPAPQLALAEQHALAGRAGLPGGGAQPVAPPPSMNGMSGTGTKGRLISLGVNPIAPTGPVAPPEGNRRGTFAATPRGKPGASGTPDSGGTIAASKDIGGASDAGTGGFRSHGDSRLPSGLHVGAPPSDAVASTQNANGNPNSAKGENSAAGDDPRVMASVTAPRVGANAKPAAAVSDDKVTAIDRQVFHGKRFYSMTLNLPNFNSATGSWVLRFAELKANQPGELMSPVPTAKSDPGYPPELIHDNVQGTVTLYAVIHSDGTVGDIRVLSSPDERLDEYARSAFARWRFVPAEKNGKAVAIEAVVMIPFRTRGRF